MKYGELSKFLSAIAALYAEVCPSQRDELGAIAMALADFPNDKSSAFAKRLSKLGRTSGRGVEHIDVIVKFCNTASFPKHEKAIVEFAELTRKFGLSTAFDLREALSAPVSSVKAPKPKVSGEAVVADYLNRLASAGSFVGGVAEVIAAIETDKKVRIEEARQIASRTLNVELSKGRTRGEYIEDLRSKFIVEDREERKLAASRQASKPWGASD